MYCKELISGSNHPSSRLQLQALVNDQRSTGGVTSSTYKQVCQTIMNNTTTYVRHTGAANANQKQSSRRDLNRHYNQQYVASQYDNSPSREINLSHHGTDESQGNMSRRRLKTASEDQGSRIKITRNRNLGVSMNRLGTASGTASRPSINNTSVSQNNGNLNLRNFESVEATHGNRPLVEARPELLNSIRDKNNSNSIDYP